MTIGEKIRQYRRLKNITQTQLGEILHISSQAIYKWERNLSEPNFETLKDIANAFEIPLNEFIKDTKYQIVEEQKNESVVENTSVDKVENKVGTTRAISYNELVKVIIEISTITLSLLTMVVSLALIFTKNKIVFIITIILYIATLIMFIILAKQSGKQKVNKKIVEKIKD